MAGVDTTGFIAKSFDDIKTEIEESVLLIDPEADLSSEKPWGQIVGIFAERERLLWELAQEVYVSGSIKQASGFSLSQLIANFELARKGATKSTVPAKMNIDAGATVPAGAVFTTSDPDARFLLTAPVTNGGGAPADFTETAEAESFGPVRANAGTLTEIATPVAGLNSVTNDVDATLGQLSESDAKFRERRRLERNQFGSATVSHIRAALLALDGVISATVSENPLSVSADGLGPYEIEAVVYDGAAPTVADDDIAQAIWDSKRVGQPTAGTTSGTATDDEGKNHVVNFSRPTVLDVYLTYQVSIDRTLFPSDGAEQIKQALADFGDATYKQGDDVVLHKLDCEVIDIAGVLDIEARYVGLAAAPTQTTNLIVGRREIADIDTGRIVVNVTGA